MTGTLRIRAFTVEEFRRMAQAGVLAEDDRVELVDGEVTEMTPIGPAHAACVMRLTTALVPRAGARAVISVQNPLVLGARSEFYPDIVVLRPPAEMYLSRLPQPSDVLLVIEVADTSLENDREVKIPRYAQSGIPEVWLVDLSHGVVHVYRGQIGGHYQSYSSFSRGTDLRPEGLQSVTLAVNEILPPKTEGPHS